MPERGFSIFSIFLLFFFGILLLGSGKNGSKREIFFFSFSAYVDPFRLKMKLGMMFFNFLHFFAIFLGILKLGSENNGSEPKNFVHSFSACPDLFCLETKPG